jgi:hypothetical protein
MRDKASTIEMTPQPYKFRGPADATILRFARALSATIEQNLKDVLHPLKYAQFEKLASVHNRRHPKDWIVDNLHEYYPALFTPALYHIGWCLYTVYLCNNRNVPGDDLYAIIADNEAMQWFVKLIACCHQRIKRDWNSKTYTRNNMLLVDQQLKEAVAYFTRRKTALCHDVVVEEVVGSTGYAIADATTYLENKDAEFAALTHPVSRDSCRLVLATAQAYGMTSSLLAVIGKQNITTKSPDESFACLRFENLLTSHSEFYVTAVASRDIVQLQQTIGQYGLKLSSVLAADDQLLLLASIAAIELCLQKSGEGTYRPGAAVNNLVHTRNSYIRQLLALAR